MCPSLEIGLCPVRQKYLPRLFKVGSGLVERGSRAVRALPRMATGIEPAAPSPLVFVMRDAAADRDCPGVHVAVIDVPAFLAGIGRSAAGEGGQERGPWSTSLGSHLREPGGPASEAPAFCFFAERIEAYTRRYFPERKSRVMPISHNPCG
jgi:hypothetical protein